MKPSMWLRDPRYIVNRICIWLWERRNPDQPWLTRDAVELLDDWIRKSDRGIEFGSGRSTAWLANRSRFLVSIEIDRAWHARVQKTIHDMGLESKVDLRLCCFDAAWKQDIENSPYVRSVDDIEDESIDYVLVDGWARAHCSQVGIQKLRPGGILVLDDANTHIPLPKKRLNRRRIPPVTRYSGSFNPPTFKAVYEALGTWRCIWTSNGKKDTVIWVKPDRQQTGTPK